MPYKMWIARNDERTCPTCRGAHLQIVNTLTPFSWLNTSSEMMIRQGPPAHPQCRCIVVYAGYAELAGIASDKDRVDEAIREWDRTHPAEGPVDGPVPNSGELIARGLRGSQNIV